MKLTNSSHLEIRLQRTCKLARGAVLQLATESVFKLRREEVSGLSVKKISLFKKFMYFYCKIGAQINSALVASQHDRGARWLEQPYGISLIEED